jgi:NADH:ubiquinone oxidoreductase subunit H
MISAALAVVSFAVVMIALYGVALIERNSRLIGVAHRRDIQPPMSDWGTERRQAPGYYAAARGLASAARLVRARTVVEDASASLRRASRALSLLATASALSIVPFAGTWGGVGTGRPMVAIDLEYGLGVLAFLILLSGLSQAATGLAERSLWSRLGALRIAGQSLIGVALLLLVLAPLVLATSSLRPHDIVAFQQGTFAPLDFLGDRFMGISLSGLDAFRLPNWFILRQPLTAILILPTLGLLLQRHSVYDTISNTSGMSGFGLDSDPSDLYWMGIESRLSSVLAAALFVSLFLGAGAIPFFEPTAILDKAQSLLGAGVPSALFFVFEAGVFATKVIVVLALASLLRRATGRARTDQSLHAMTRRLIPLAWANLLLLSALSLLSSTNGGILR